MAATNPDTPEQSTGYLSAIGDRFEQYFGIGERFASAAWFPIAKIWQSVKHGDFGVFFKLNTIRDEAFAEFYKAYSHGFAAYEATTVVPALVASAHGLVLELGPGPGLQLSRFSAPKIQHIIGVEPNAAFSEQLAARLQDTALVGKYTAVFCGIEDDTTLARHGVVAGSMDCVVDMQVLCSVRDPAKVARRLYEVLKPGGELLFWEHCRNEDLITRGVQWLWSNIWQLVFGDCRLDKDLKSALLNAGDWEIMEFQQDKEPHLLMPRVSGRFVKRA